MGVLSNCFNGVTRQVGKATLVFTLTIGSWAGWASTAVSQNLPEWASSYGMQSPFPKQTHLTGFGMTTINGSTEEAIEDARTQAAANLIRKVKTTVQSRMSSEMSENNGEFTDRFSSVSRTVSNLTLEGIDYRVAQDEEACYALAFVERKRAVQYYMDQLEQLHARIKQGKTTADESRDAGKVTRALEQYLKLRPLTSSYLEAAALVRVLEGGSGRIFASQAFGELSTPQQMARLDKELVDTIDGLFEEPVNTLDEGFDLLARQFQIQGVTAGDLKVNDFNYQDSNFSSEFGAFAARKLNSQCSALLPSGDEQLIVRSMYWDEGEAVRLISIAQDVNGNELGSAEVSIPKSSIPSSYEIRPRNASQALMDQKVMSEEGLTDGGISVDAWTNKGNDDDNLVFRPSDELQMYFRVNQPSHLRLSYILSNGTKILLIDDFYIGLDKVNKVVKAPFVFSPSPPFGVERMIITAYSKKPPSIATTSKTIDGEVYDNVIQDGLKEMMVKTRGIKLKKNSDDKMRVGETSLTFTMMGN